MTNGFALNHDKSFLIFFFCIKHQAKNYSKRLRDAAYVIPGGGGRVVQRCCVPYITGASN